MSTVITAGNATNGLSLSADNAGAFEFKTGTGAGTTALTLSSTQVATFAGAVTSASTVAGAAGTLYPLVRGTAVASTSGTSIDFTGIPSWVDRITVMFNAVSVSGTSLLQVQLGDSGGIETTSYVGVSQTGTTSNSSTTGLLVNAIGNAGYVITGVMTIVNLSTNLWISSGTSNTDPALGNFANSFSGRKTLSDVLTQIRITTVNGTDTFDAGSINILYE